MNFIIEMIIKGKPFDSAKGDVARECLSIYLGQLCSCAAYDITRDCY